MLTISHLPRAALKPFEHNARLHPAHQVEQIAASIEAFGFNDPIAVDADGVIIEGHGRLQALDWLRVRGRPIPAGLQSWNTVPVIQLGHLDEAQRRAYVLAHNRIAQNSEGDDGLLSGELEFLSGAQVDLGVLGFDAEDLDDLLDGADSGGDAPDAVGGVLASHTAPVVAAEAADERIAPSANSAAPVRVHVLVALSQGDAKRWRDLKKALGITDDSAAFRRVAGLDAAPAGEAQS